MRLKWRNDGMKLGRLSSGTSPAYYLGIDLRNNRGTYDIGKRHVVNKAMKTMTP